MHISTLHYMYKRGVGLSAREHISTSTRTTRVEGDETEGCICPRKKEEKKIELGKTTSSR